MGRFLFLRGLRALRPSASFLAKMAKNGATAGIFGKNGLPQGPAGRETGLRPAGQTCGQFSAASGRARYYF
eukprot:NODE_6119_length_652_cov_5.404643_g5193_i0.p3 GENE.NODE_6119_length_652_cov_5.404643_g5193_i0~~NODE_6119_length_652_cov_5.404643_g5193_i0.p3  ORF type:complete len:71 (+),score=2.96 NODE_6119_length_652_cov_5.404643_g5193_i0:196-408(+)